MRAHKVFRLIFEGVDTSTGGYKFRHLQIDVDRGEYASEPLELFQHIEKQLKRKLKSGDIVLLNESADSSIRHFSLAQPTH